MDRTKKFVRTHKTAILVGGLYVTTMVAAVMTARASLSDAHLKLMKNALEEMGMYEQVLDQIDINNPSY